MRTHCLRLALTLSLLGPAVAAAQTPPATVPGEMVSRGAARRDEARQHAELLLLAPEAVRTAWAVALQVELAERGTTVVPLPAPTGSHPLIRDAEGQRAALARGADTAVVVETTPHAYEVRLVSADGSRARVSPVSQEVDSRTAALIVVSLLDEPRLRASTQDAEASSMTAPAEPLGAADELSMPHGPAGPSVAWSGLVGSGGYLLVNDQRLVPGTLVRAGVGLRYDHLEMTLLGDFGVMLEELDGPELDEPLALQSMLRVCLEGGFRIPIDSVGVHGGLRACGGYVELHAVQFPDASGVPLFLDQVGGLLSAGGYLAVSLGLTESIRWLARVELDVGAREVSLDLVEAIPTVSTLLSFEVE